MTTAASELDERRSWGPSLDRWGAAFAGALIGLATFRMTVAGNPGYGHEPSSRRRDRKCYPSPASVPAKPRMPGVRLLLARWEAEDATRFDRIVAAIFAEDPDFELRCRELLDHGE